MKRKQFSDQLERASTVIKADRMGVSAGIEGLIAAEIKNLLNDYFSLSDEVNVKIEVLQNQFNLTIKASALSVKNVKMLG
jgi:hypothetical protein